MLFLKLFNFGTDFFLVNSEKTKQWLRETEKIRDEKITVIPNAIDHGLFYKASKVQMETFRNQFGFTKQTVLIGIVANLRPVKSIDVFIKAAKLVKEEIPQAGFIIVGEGSEREVLQSICRDLGISNSVRFLGERFDVPEILSCLDVGVLSSSSESFSNSIIEYMASGLPVVCTEVGGVLEAIDSGVNGFIVKSKDHRDMASKILRAINYLEHENVISFNKKKIESMFSINIVIEKYNKFFKSILMINKKG